MAGLPEAVAYRALRTTVRFIETGGARLAWRSFGEGQPIVLCTRFRGTMASWDPAFLDVLARQGCRVILFDPAGLGYSEGRRRYNPIEMVDDVRNLLDGLGLDRVALLGWSLGGMVAQAALTTLSPRLSHLALIGTAPPGPCRSAAQQLFFDLAAAPEGDERAQLAIAFDPSSERSRRAARRSMQRLARWDTTGMVPVPPAWAAAQLGDEPRNPIFPAPEVRDAMLRCRQPVLCLCGARDIGFPAENWQAISACNAGIDVRCLPDAGNAPHHQYPRWSAHMIGRLLLRDPA
ncbi:alpha/beta fold hydrolase [Roseomonas fluvialis]|uniref:AB hydrolase-1 domain-containing protein n=1 Tax=Roseomonas fluvialis TaxID=1750527 RepID=A0ABN6P6P0_9PROT|nr:alpha/beta hydrolase [Roseomonas fluvialis]BDG74353.1 hypothetical protein Rmf_42820 [Roseomonas fluvialis]